MTMTDPDLAIAAALAGADVVRSHFGGPLVRYEKGGGDFATAADLDAERAIISVLRAERPDDVVLGEESGRTGPGTGERTWFVDPLCGTRNFAANSPIVAVNVALRVGRDRWVAASADPFMGEVFWTDGADAFVRNGGTDSRLAPSSDSRLVEIDLDAPLPGPGPFRAARLIAAPRFVATFSPRVLSTTLAVPWVAAGRRAAYITDGPTRNDVHLASGIAICRTAGCVVTDLHGLPLSDGGSGLLVAADRPTHSLLLELVEEQF